MFAEPRKTDARQKCKKKCRPKRDFLKARGLSEKPLTQREFDVMVRLIEKESIRLERETAALLRATEMGNSYLKGFLQRAEQSN